MTSLPMAPVPHRVAHRDLIRGIPSYAGHIRYTLTPVPRQVRIETSSLCNSVCPWCAGHGANNPLVLGGKGMTRPKEIMPFEMAEAIIKDIVSWPRPPYEIVPTNYGELFMNRRWFEIAQLVDALIPKTRLTLVTTGILVTDQVLEQLVKVKTLKYVNFSVNAFFQETYERIHGSSAKALLRIPALIERLRNMRPDIWVAVSMVYDTTLVTEVERELFVNYWKPRVNAVSINNVSFADSPMRRPVEEVVLPCRSVVDGLVIFSDGEVSNGCCFNADHVPELSLGRFPEQRLMDIWAGPKIREIVDIHNAGRRGELTICKGCTYA